MQGLEQTLPSWHLIPTSRFSPKAAAAVGLANNCPPAAANISTRREPPASRRLVDKSALCSLQSTEWLLQVAWLKSRCRPFAGGFKHFRRLLHSGSDAHSAERRLGHMGTQLYHIIKISKFLESLPFANHNHSTTLDQEEAGGEKDQQQANGKKFYRKQASFNFGPLIPSPPPLPPRPQPHLTRSSVFP